MAVKNEVELLKKLCSEGEQRFLKSIQYTSGLNYRYISLGHTKVYYCININSVLRQQNWLIPVIRKSPVNIHENVVFSFLCIITD